MRTENKSVPHKPGRPVPVYDHLDRHVGSVGVNASEAVATRFLGQQHNGATYRNGGWYGNPPRQPNPPRGGGPAVSSLNHRDSVVASLNNAKPKRKI
jgi:hypothetical protein